MADTTKNIMITDRSLGDGKSIIIANSDARAINK